MTPTGPSVHLSWKELACHTDPPVAYPTDLVDRAQALAAEFEAIREACALRLGHAQGLRVISAFRTADHNHAVGGVGGSQHVFGRALDVAPPEGMSLQEFANIVLLQAQARGIIRGIGIYRGDGHLHFDLRPQVELAQWEG